MRYIPPGTSLHRSAGTAEGSSQPTPRGRASKSPSPEQRGGGGERASAGKSAVARELRAKQATTHGLGLESLDRLDFLRRVDGDGLELADGLLELIDDGLVLKDAPVVRKVDGAGPLGLDEERVGSRGLGGALAERLEGSEGLYICESGQARRERES